MCNVTRVCVVPGRLLSHAEDFFFFLLFFLFRGDQGAVLESLADTMKAFLFSMQAIVFLTLPRSLPLCVFNFQLPILDMCLFHALLL